MELKPILRNDGLLHPGLIIIPGGGYNHLSNHEGENVAEYFGKPGINCFVLKYDFMFPQSLYDVKKAVRLVRFKAEEYNTDPERIALMGFSAGAHLAGLCAEHFDAFETEPKEPLDTLSARPDLCCFCYPVVTLSKPYGHMGSRITLNGRDDLAETLSLESSVRADMPPAFIWHTFEDKSVPFENSVELAKAMAAAGAECELHIFPKGKHGLDLAQNIPGAENWPALFADFLKRHNFLQTVKS
ncbi:MAG: alpha/beta hydrolase [Clostridiales bacterium]|nr:alpha/beta hydrolase [Clostridiales bacterium]